MLGRSKTGFSPRSRQPLKKFSAMGLRQHSYARFAHGGAGSRNARAQVAQLSRIEHLLMEFVSDFAEV